MYIVDREGPMPEHFEVGEKMRILRSFDAQWFPRNMNAHLRSSGRLSDPYVGMWRLDRFPACGVAGRGWVDLILYYALEKTLNVV